MMSERSGEMDIHITHDLSSVESIRRVNRTRCVRENTTPFYAVNTGWTKKMNGAPV